MRLVIASDHGGLRLKNELVPGVEGSVTLHLPSARRLSIFDAAAAYQADGVPLMIVAGR